MAVLMRRGKREANGVVVAVLGAPRPAAGEPGELGGPTPPDKPVGPRRATVLCRGRRQIAQPTRRDGYPNGEWPSMDGKRSAGKPVSAALRLCCGGVVVAVAAVLVGGCASAQQPDVERVARAFAQSGAADRCALLAPATVAALEHDEAAPCGDALAQLALPDGGRVPAGRPRHR
jgi:hypothetical protein